MTYRTQAEVGERIRTLRSDAALSQRELGEVLGVDQTAVSRIESGDRALTGRELMLAADYFGVPSASIIQAEEDALTLLRAGDAEQDDVKRSLDEFRSCIEDYFGVEALVG
jgi:transcriptional regulator with XRE-family HTH domain